MDFIVVGTNHKYSPIGLREKICFTKKQSPRTAFLLTESPNIKSAIFLSTCNRSEIYATVGEPERGVMELKNFFSGYHEIPEKLLAPHLYNFVNREAIAHLFRVSAGLDSQVLGETEILGQVREAYTLAKGAEMLDNFIDMVFLKAIEVGRLVRTKTQVSFGKVSVGSVAFELIKKKLGTLKGRKILIIGMGKISNLITKYLKDEEVSAIFVSNRTFEKAVRFAEELKGVAIRFDDIKRAIGDVDVIISATASPHVILRREDLGYVNKPLLIMDLALPRDVDPAVKIIKDITLFNLEDLNLIIDKNLEMRKREAGRAGELIKEEVNRITGQMAWTV